MTPDSSQQAPGRPRNRRAERMDLRHTPTARDFREAHRAHARGTSAGRRRLAVTLALTVAVMAVGIRGGSVTLLSLLMGAAYLFFALVALPRAQAGRAAAKAAADGGQQVRLDEAGVRLTTGAEQRRFAWTEISRYLETPRLFLLVGADRAAPCLAVLPKEGSGDRLRALLDARLDPARTD
ncbi:YcxB family protein [Streptomyces sp. NPDC005012]|uniref:YcxB family protein n=1 Tax=Streptomyces sp. NPDC005012 TaxID=3154558 RepID=UPI0033A62D79